MRHVWKTFCIVVLLAGLLPLRLQAQSEFGNITGLVSDPSGGVLGSCRSHGDQYRNQHQEDHQHHCRVASTTCPLRQGRIRFRSPCQDSNGMCERTLW